MFDLDAVDNDIGPNGEIRYSIVPLPNSDRDGSGKFSVDPITGLIQTTSADLNAESQAKYEVSPRTTHGHCSWISVFVQENLIKQLR